MNDIFKPYLVKESAVRWLSERLCPRPLLSLERGGPFPYGTFADALATAGYGKVDYVDGRNQFSFSMEGASVWPAGSANPFRVSFFGPDIESIYAYDPESQLPIEDGDRLDIYSPGVREGRVDRETVYHVAIAGGLVMSGKDVLRRLPGRFLGGLRAGGSVLAEASFLARALSGEPSMEDRLEEWARMAGVWIGDPREVCPSGRCSLVAEGDRSTVWRDAAGDGGHVVKVTRMDAVEDCLDWIAVHNALFPRTALEVLGFGRSRSGLAVFVRQEYFPEGRRAGVEEIRTLAREAGLRAVSDRDVDGYCTKEALLEGFVEENVVMTPTGAAVLGGRCRLNTVELRRGGTWRIPEVEYRKDAVEEIGMVLQEVTPWEVEKTPFVRDHETKANMLGSQLEVTGRFNGYFTEGGDDEDGGCQVAVAACPDNGDVLLVMDCGNIRRILQDETGLPKKEKDEICYGFGMWIDGSFVAFDVATGRLKKALPFLDTLRQQLFQDEGEQILQGLKQGRDERKNVRSKSKAKGRRRE